MPHLSADALRRFPVSTDQGCGDRQRRRLRREERQGQAEKAAGQQNRLVHRSERRRLRGARDARHRHLSGHEAPDQRGREPRLPAGAVPRQRQAVYPGGSPRPDSEIHRRRRGRRAQALAAGRQGLGQTEIEGARKPQGAGLRPREALRRAAEEQGLRLWAGHAVAAGI